MQQKKSVHATLHFMKHFLHSGRCFATKRAVENFVSDALSNNRGAVTFNNGSGHCFLEVHQPPVHNKQAS